MIIDFRAHDLFLKGNFLKAINYDLDVFPLNKVHILFEYKESRAEVVYYQHDCQIHAEKIAVYLHSCGELDCKRITDIVPLYIRNVGPSEIIPNLYLGSWSEFLNSFSEFKNIVNVSSELPEPIVKNGCYYNFKIQDDPGKYDIEKCYNETTLNGALDLITGALGRTEKVIVHCFRGQSRSATIVAAYLIKNLDMSVDDAIDHIVEKRPCVSIKKGFVSQLRRFLTR